MCVNGFLVRFCWWDWCVSLRRVLSASVVCVCAQRHAIMCGTRKRTKKKESELTDEIIMGAFSHTFLLLLFCFTLEMRKCV